MCINRKGFMKMIKYGIKDKRLKYFDDLKAPCSLYNIFGPAIQQIAGYAYTIKGELNKIPYLDTMMYYYGFTRIGKGLNRCVYHNQELPNIVIKVSTTSSGAHDAVREMKNQTVLKPHCTKTFEYYPGGCVGMFEKVGAFDNDSICCFDGLLGSFVFYNMLEKNNIMMNDIADYQNFGLRFTEDGDSCFVILDYPYMFKRDENKSYCTILRPDGTMCGGRIGYSGSYDCICCNKCGAPYKAQDVASLVDQIFLASDSLRNPDLEYTIVNTETGEIRYDSRKGKMDNFMKP